MHPLAAWIASKGLSQKEFAVRVQVERSNLCAYLKGRRGISPPAAQRIRDATDGAFTLEFLLGLRPARPSRRVRARGYEVLSGQDVGPGRKKAAR